MRKMRGKCIRVEYQKPKLVLSIEFYDWCVEIDITEKFKRNLELIATDVIVLTPKVQKIIKETMPERIELIIDQKQKLNVDLLHLLPWARKVYERMKKF